MIRRLSPVVLALALVAAACGSDDAADTTAATTTTTQATTTTTQATTTTTAPATTTTMADPEISFVGADGVESVITDTSRIISLNGDITEVLYALGVGDQVVAVDVTTIYPEESDGLPRVGFVRDLAPESILAFSPTVVIGDTQAGPTETIDQLRQTGIPVVIIETYTTLDGIEDKITDIATVAGVPEAGEALAATTMAEIDEVRVTDMGIEEPVSAAFLYVRSPNQIFLLGQGSVTQAMIEGVGAIDVVAAAGLPGLVPLTPEALVAAAPDVLILPQLGTNAIGGIDGVLGLPGVAETPAGLNGNFLVYEDTFLLNFGPRTGQFMAQLAADLYPELGN